MGTVERVALVMLGLFAAWCPSEARAFVPIPVGGHPGETDLMIRAGFERGLIEPNENQASWRKANWELFQLGVGHTIGTVGPFEFLYVRLDQQYYIAPAETNELGELVFPEKNEIAACIGRRLPGGACEFHPADSGTLLTPQIGADLVHTADFSFGVFVQGTIPIGVDLERFVLPRIDYIAGGTQLGVHVTPWFGATARLYVGSGAFGKQNAAVAMTNLYVFEAKKWLLPWKVGIALGPYFEGDITERFDAAYDAAYTADYPDREDRIRSMRFGAAMLPFMAITENAALELGYVQKLFGYDVPATQFWYAGARASL
jgi:hypothetical protein